MSSYINFNGTIIPSGNPVITADNRGFRYGDGVFETIKVVNRSILLSSYHFHRLFAGLKLLAFDLPQNFTAETLAAQINTLCKKNKHANARVRLAVFRGNGGLYDPENNLPNYIIQSFALEPAFDGIGKGLVIDIFPDGRKAIDAFSNLKSNNYLVYAMAALHAKKNQLDDCIILNSHENICDSTIANIFCIKGNTVFTPALSEGCVAGVMRRYLLSALPGLGLSVEETKITGNFLVSSNEIFLSNAIAGIKWVKGFRGHSYKNEMSAFIHASLLKNFNELSNF